MKYIEEYTLELNKSFYRNIVVKQNDTARYLKFTIYDKGVPFSLKDKDVRFSAKKPDGTYIFNNLAIKDEYNGMCELHLSNQILAASGVVNGEINIYEGMDIVSSLDLKIKVEKSYRNESAIESSSEFTALTEALAVVESGGVIKTVKVNNPLNGVLQLTLATYQKAKITEECEIILPQSSIPLDIVLEFIVSSNNIAVTFPVAKWRSIPDELIPGLVYELHLGYDGDIWIGGIIPYGE